MTLPIKSAAIAALLSISTAAMAQPVPVQQSGVNGVTVGSTVPSILAGSTVVAATYSTDLLQYALGAPRLCNVVVQLDWTAMTATAGPVTIQGIPKDCGTTSGAAVQVTAAKTYGFNGAIDATVATNGVISLTYQSAGSISSEAAVQGTSLPATGGIYLNMTIIVHSPDPSYP